MKAGAAMIVLAFMMVACKANPAGQREERGSGTSLASSPGFVSRGAPSIVNESLKGSADALSAGDPAMRQDSRAIAHAMDTSTAPSMIIRTGQASVEADKLDPVLVKLRQMAAQLGGYVANSSFSGGRDQVRSATLELKIPAAKYDQAATGLNGIGKLESINTNAEDVGEEYVDIDARVANARRLEERLVSLLATRTGKLEDVLAVERELARVREEIERYEGRMRFLRTRSAMSTLSVTIHEPVPILGRTPGENPISAAVRQAWRNFVALIAGFIASLGILVPTGIVGLAGWSLYRRHNRLAGERSSRSGKV